MKKICEFLVKFFSKTDHCLTKSELENYVTRKYSSTELKNIESHVAACQACHLQLYIVMAQNHAIPKKHAKKIYQKLKDEMSRQSDAKIKELIRQCLNILQQHYSCSK